MISTHTEATTARHHRRHQLGRHRDPGRVKEARSPLGPSSVRPSGSEQGETSPPYSGQRTPAVWESSPLSFHCNLSHFVLAPAHHHSQRSLARACGRRPRPPHDQGLARTSQTAEICFGHLNQAILLFHSPPEPIPSRSRFVGTACLRRWVWTLLQCRAEISVAARRGERACAEKRDFILFFCDVLYLGNCFFLVILPTWRRKEREQCRCSIAGIVQGKGRMSKQGAKQSKAIDRPTIRSEGKGRTVAAEAKRKLRRLLDAREREPATAALAATRIECARAQRKSLIKRQDSLLGADRPRETKSKRKEARTALTQPIKSLRGP